MTRRDSSKSGPSPSSAVRSSMTGCIPEPMTLGISQLEGLLAARAPVGAWVDSALEDIGTFSADVADERFLLAFSSAGRHLGKGSIALEPAESAVLASSGVDWAIDGWGMDELGRVLLLGAAFAGLPPERAASLLEACYARG